MMNSQMNALVEQLKDAGEDFEFYPTTKAMVRTIWKHATEHGSYSHQVHWDLLDIGCGTCNFRRWIEELNREEPGILHLHKYFVIEKKHRSAVTPRRGNHCLGDGLSRNHSDRQGR